LKALRLFGLCVLIFIVAVPAWRAFIVTNWNEIRLECMVKDISSSETIITNDWDYGKCGNVIHGADVQEYYYYFQQYPDDAKQLRLALASPNAFYERIGTEYYKRPAFGPLTTALGFAWHQLTGAGFPERMFDLLSVYAALASTLVFATFLRVGATIGVSILATLGASTSYAWLPIFTIPESYSLSTAAAMAVVYSAIDILLRLDRDGRLPSTRLLTHAAIVVFASLLYLPNFGGILFIFAGRERSAKDLAHCLGIGAMAVLVVMLPQFLLHFTTHGEFGPANQVAYGFQWGSPLNLLNPMIWLDAIAAFSVFLLVPSSWDLLHVGGDVRWGALSSHGMLWPLFILALSVVASAVWVIQRGWSRASIPFAIWFAALLAFHAFFNPAEVLLYNAVPLGVAVGWLALSLRTAPVAKVPDPVAIGLLAGLAVISAANLFVVIGYGGS